MEDFDNNSLHSLRDMVADRKVSARDMCTQVLQRVSERNRELGILTDVLSSVALREAEEVDKRIAAGGPAGKLAGIPVVVKDNIDTVPAVCSAGFPSLSAYRPTADAAVVRRLRDEGAVIIGVAATDGGGFGVVTPSVKNPAFPGKIAGGSSGGSAAAVAAGYCKAAIGTDTGGSIRIPAACCGVVGLKPTFGLVPSDGVRPLSTSADHVGPLARSVADVRSVMEIYLDNTLPDARLLHSKKIGIPQTYFADASTDVQCVLADAARCCRHLGHELQEVSIPAPEEIIPAHLILSLTEAVRLHLEKVEEDINAYPDAAKEGLLLGQSYRSHEYLDAVEQRRGFVTCINELFASVDFLLLPTLPVLAPDEGTRHVMVAGHPMSILQAMIRYTAAFDQSGHPALALPWPVRTSDVAGSIQIVGRLGSDLRLLAFAEQIESVRDGMSPTPD